MGPSYTCTRAPADGSILGLSGILSGTPPQPGHNAHRYMLGGPTVSVTRMIILTYHVIILLVLAKWQEHHLNLAPVLSQDLQL